MCSVCNHCHHQVTLKDLVGKAQPSLVSALFELADLKYTRRIAVHRSRCRPKDSCLCSLSGLSAGSAWPERSIPTPYLYS